MARQIIAIDGMTTEDCTFSVGIVHGGQWVNCVATTCSGEALSMAKRQDDLDRGVERMLALSGTANDVTFQSDTRRDAAGMGSPTPEPWRFMKRRAVWQNKWASSSARQRRRRLRWQFYRRNGNPDPRWPRRSRR